MTGYPAAARALCCAGPDASAEDKERKHHEAQLRDQQEADESEATQRSRHFPNCWIRIRAEPTAAAAFLAGRSMSSTRPFSGSRRCVLLAVGLGAAPRQLGRADTLSEFILTGRDVAVTELELLDDEATGRTRTIERRITRSQRGTSKWKIDGKSATEPQVKELVEKDLKRLF